MSFKDAAKTVRAFVAGEEKMKYGHFMVWDKADDKALILRLERVEGKTLKDLADQRLLVTAEFRAASGGRYLLDFVLDGTTPSGLSVEGITVYRKLGQAPRYQWKEDNGLWQKSAKP